MSSMELAYVVGVFSLASGLIGGLVAMYLNGTYIPLKEAHPGDVVNFVYLQPAAGQPERYLAKVVGVSKLTQEQIARLDKKSYYRSKDVAFKRTEHLIKCVMKDGTLRNFYAERTVDCKKVPFGGIFHKVS